MSRSVCRPVVYGVVMLSVLCARITVAQQPDVRPYETEEDLWEAFREGEISPAEYHRLQETFRVGTDTLFVPESDWEELPGSGAGYLSAVDTSIGLASPEPVRESGAGPIKARWRSGFDGRLSAPAAGDGYLTGRVEGTGWHGLFNWKQDDRGGRWQRRVFEYRYRAIRFQAGNVEPRWGRGLVVGRRSRLIGAKKATRTDGDFWQPSLSRFNGVWFGSNSGKTVSAEVLLSDIRSAGLRERMAAFQVTAGHRLVRAGLVGLSGTIRRTDTSGLFAQRVYGGHVRVGRKERVILAEIAMAENGATSKAVEAVWRFERGRFHGKAWSYSAEFINPWGGGPAHGDGSTVVLDEIGESYSSRTTGERGFSLRTQVDPRAAIMDGRLSAHWDWMTHREGSSEPLIHSWVVQLRWRKRDLMVRPFVRGTQNEDEPGRHAVGFFTNYGPIDRRVSARLEMGRHRADADRYVRAGGGIKWRLSQAVRLQPSFRWVDPDLKRPGDGYWYFYFTEVIFPADAWRFEAALVWQRYERRDRGDVAELRLRMVAGW